MAARSSDGSSFRRFVRQVFRAIFETRELSEEGERHISDGTVTLLGDDEIGQPFQVLAIALVHFFAEDEAYEIGILLDGSGIAEIAQLRFVIAHTRFRSAAQLRE